MELVIGGSGSGKSEFAENLILSLCTDRARLIYIATMYPDGKEALQKIERHLKMRSDKDFQTIECFSGLINLEFPKACTVLLDSISNLLANEMFRSDGINGEAASEIVKGIRRLKENSSNLIVVTDDIFLEGSQFEELTIEYMKNLAAVNRDIADMSDAVMEVVCGIPILLK